MVNTAAEAEFIVKASKFPPLGVRGQGSPFSSWASSLATPDYVKAANESLLTIVQIETEEAVKNVDAIAAVPGVGESPSTSTSLLRFCLRGKDGTELMVDAVFIGPNDLALGFLGYAPPKWTEPEYLALIDTVVEAAKKAGKPCGILMPDGEKAKWAKEKWGIQIMAMTTDVKAIQFYMAAQIAAAKQ